MPIPKPRKDEEEDNFMGRCMGDDVMNREYPDNKQRYAICKVSWDKKDNNVDNETENKEKKEENHVNKNKALENLSYTFESNEAFTHAVKDGGDIMIAGYATTEKLNVFKQIVLAESFSWEGALARFNGRVLGFHGQEKPPVGVVENMDVQKGKGIWVKVRIYKENSELLKRSIREGILNAFSIGFNVKEYKYDEKAETYTFLKCILNEISVCHIGANDEAIFEVLNSLKQETNNNNERDTMSLTEKEKSVLLSLSDFDPKATATKQEQLSENVEKLQTLNITLMEQVKNLQDGVITKAELAERMNKIHADITKISQDIETAKNANAYDSTKVVYNDYRSLIKDFVWLTNDAGDKVNNIAQKAYCLFQMPVDYKTLNAGQDLKNLRDLHDAVVMVDAIYRFRGRDRHNIKNMKLWDALVKQTAMFDKELSHAMAGGNTGYGAEWIPEEMSAEFNEILRVMPTLPNKFQTWNMPKGSSAKFPFQNGKALVYRGSEATVNNPSEARKTNIATGAKTFTPEVFIGALVSSEELTEDAIMDMVGLIRKELATALNEGLEAAIINGDDSVTHMDNAHTTTYVPSYDVRTIFKGLRQLGNAAHVDATTGVGNTTLAEIINTKNALGIAGLRNGECGFVTGINGRTQIQAALFNTDAIGILPYMISGTLPQIAGSEVYISGVYEEDLDADGYYNSGSQKHASAVCVHFPSFRIGQRRGITLEYSKNILTQQQAFVATARYDFGKICADAIVPVASLIGMDYTA